MAGIVEGLFAARAGIQSNGTAISVIGDNIANANTVGYKPSRADFTDVLAGSLAGGGVTVGSGSQVLKTTPVFTQGTLERTGRGLDLGIQGNGFFIVRDAQGSGQTFYTRAGNLEVDSDGFLVDQNGFKILGFSPSGAGGLQSLNVNQATSNGSSISTNAVTIGGNLDAGSAVSTLPTGTPSFQQLSDSANFSSSLNVFDSLGAKHTVTAFYFHTSPNNWQVQAYVDGGEITGQTAGQPYQIGSATLAFGTDGNRVSPVPATDFTATPAWNNGSTAGSMTFSFTPFTQLAEGSATTSVTQDGTGTGRVVAFSVNEDGKLLAKLDNGQSSTIGTVALASFADQERLQRVGQSLFSQSSGSGEAVLGSPASGIFGKVESGTLELSSADIANDFVKLISLQRGYQGCSRVISTINQLTEELVNLAR